MLDRTKYKSKPQGQQVGIVQNSLKQTTISIEELATLLSQGCSFRPAYLKPKGRKDEDWIQQQIIGLDFDHDTTIEDTLAYCKQLNLLPAFIYTSFSHSEDEHKFRLVFQFNNPITNKDTIVHIMNIFKKLFPNADKRTFTLSRLYYGGRQLIYENYNEYINVDELLNKYTYLEKMGNENNNTQSSVVNSAQTLIEPSKNGALGEKGLCNNILSIWSFNPINTLKPNIQAILERDVITLRNNLNTFTPTIFQCKQDMFDYINTELDIGELLEIEYPKSFRCIFHDDNNPSASIFQTKKGMWLYQCHSESCGFKGNIVFVIQKITKMRTYQCSDFIKEIYNLEVSETEWQIEQKRILEHNKQMILDGTIEQTYPELYSTIRRYIPQLLVFIDIALMHVRDDNYLDSNGNVLFYASNNTLCSLLNSKSSKRINQRTTLLALVELVKKMDKNEIPQKELNQAIVYAKKNNYSKITNFFAMGEYNSDTLNKSQQEAIAWKNSNLTMNAISYEGIYRALGKGKANIIYPQYKNKVIKIAENQYIEVPRTTTKASDERTNNIAIVVDDYIQKQGYAIEKDVIEDLRNTYGKTITQIQIKRSMQEMLDSYGWQRVRCNKELKKKYKIKSNGYPFIIISIT